MGFLNGRRGRDHGGNINVRTRILRSRASNVHLGLSPAWAATYRQRYRRLTVPSGKECRFHCERSKCVRTAGTPGQGIDETRCLVRDVVAESALVSVLEPTH